VAEKHRHQPTTDVSGRAGDEHSRG
jgi:hypothetical protein